MADDISFLTEIDESLRVEKLEQFWQRSGNLVIAACVGIVLMTGLSVLWKNHVHSLRMEQTSVLLKAQALLDAGKPAEASKMLETAENGTADLAALAKLRRAEILIQGGKSEEALTLYSQVVDSRADESLHDLAALEMEIISDNHGLKHGKEGKRIARDGRPFAGLMHEIMAVRLAKDGKNDEARTLLSEDIGNIKLPKSERARDMELLDTIAGDKP